MQLYIDTTGREIIILRLLDKKGKIIKQHAKRVFQISENLLPEIEKFLKKNKLEIRQIHKVLANPGPGGFSSTRTGVAVANALNLALGINFEPIVPKYDKEPNITRPKTRSLFSQIGVREKGRGRKKSRL